MQEIKSLCTNASIFPRNFGHHNPQNCNLKEYYEQLNAHAGRLFSNENDAALDFYYLEENGADFWEQRINKMSGLQDHLKYASPTKTPDPRCRLLFIHAIRGSSRNRLRTTRDMLMLCFTYFRVMPNFIDFLISFGYQTTAQDPYFSAFHQRTNLSKNSQSLQSDELGWSGYEMQVCYNLHSVEQKGSDWSVRSCAVHHTFDVKHIRSTWIIVKGSDSLKDRVEQVNGDSGLDGPTSYESLDKAFAAALATHLIHCEWAEDEWRWYIRALEERLQQKSGRTLTAHVSLPTSQSAFDQGFPLPRRTDTQKTEETILSRISRRSTQLSERLSLSRHRPKVETSNGLADGDTECPQPLPPHVKSEPSNKVMFPAEQAYDDLDEEDFSFEKLQGIQYIEEKVHEAVLVLRLNLTVIQRLLEHYKTVTSLTHFPETLAKQCKPSLEVFEMRINSIKTNIEVHLLRLDTLLRLLVNRKVLLHSILEHQNTQINKRSDRNMVSMTEDMNDIARKTKIETVSMKVITVVTLFFLPGTFISTLMSTDIFQSYTVKHQRPDPYVRLSPLQIYLAASLPLTVVTIFVWGFLHWLEKRREDHEKEQSMARRLAPGNA